MTDKVQLIKQEIERQIEEGKVKCQQSKENNDYESFIAWSEHVATCGKLLVFINSIPEEPAVKGITWKDVNTLDTLIDQVRHEFPNGISEKSFGLAVLEKFQDYHDIEEPASEDLEKVAISAWNNYVGLDLMHIEEVIAFANEIAEWQKQQMKEALQTEYEKGRFDMREEMMKDAVDGEYWDGSIYLDNRPTEYKDGDKVKIIIVKEN